MTKNELPLSWINFVQTFTVLQRKLSVMEKIHKFGQLMRYSHPNFQRLHEQLNVAPTREERLRILNQTRKSALKDFPVQLDKLDKLLLNYNPFFILANFSFCYLTYLPEAGHSMNDSAAIIIGQPHVELVQALILCHYEQEFQCKPITPPEFQELSDLVGCVVCLHRIKDMPAFDGASDQEVGGPGR